MILENPVEIGSLYPGTFCPKRGDSVNHGRGFRVVDEKRIDGFVVCYLVCFLSCVFLSECLCSVFDGVCSWFVRNSVDDLHSTIWSFTGEPEPEKIEVVVVPYIRAKLNAIHKQNSGSQPSITGHEYKRRSHRDFVSLFPREFPK